MELNNLPKLMKRSKKRLGRGLGSGKGKTGGRGQKGQKARGKIPAANVGGGLILYKKLPYVRGWSRKGGNPPRALKPVIITTQQLNTLTRGSVVNMESLMKQNIISTRDAKKRGVKILVSGELTTALTIALPVSKKAQEMIEKAGGKVDTTSD